MKKAYAYIRVSGRGQEQREGPKMQKKAIFDYASKNGIEIAGFFEDVHTGTVENRPELAKMLYSLEQNGLDVHTVLIHRLDRLARDLMVQEFIIRDMNKIGIKLVSVHEGEDLASNDPNRKMHRQIMGTFAEYEKSMLVLKLKIARQRVKAKTGRCEGNKGYDITNPKLIDRLRELHRKPRKQKRRSCQQIADELNQDEKFTSRSGKPFTRHLINHLLKQYRMK